MLRSDIDNNLEKHNFPFSPDLESSCVDLDRVERKKTKRNKRKEKLKAFRDKKICKREKKNCKRKFRMNKSEIKMLRM